MGTKVQPAPLVILGSGLGAYTLAREWRRQDPDSPLIIITADDGASYYKPNLSNALSKKHMPDDLVQMTVSQVAEQYQVEILTYCRVTHIDLTTQMLQLDKGGPIAWQKLVLAVGAHPIQAPLEGNATDRVRSINNRLDFEAFHRDLAGSKRVTIMGAGLIGTEFANDLIDAGFEVDVVAPSESLLTGLVPEAIGRALQTELEARGVRFHLGPMVSRVDTGDKKEGSLKISLTNGQQLQADTVLSAVGLQPNLHLARGAGLTVNRGIIVDKYLQTSHPSVYALGDCAEVEGQLRMFVMPLMHSARALAKTLAGETTPVNWPAMPITVKTPACPVIAYPPRTSGEWQIDGKGANLAAVCRRGDDVIGFALCGERIKDRNTWLKVVPPLLAT